MPGGQFDFGYPWWLSYGHLVVLIPSLALLVLAIQRKWAHWITLLAGFVVVWSASALLLTRFGFNANGIPPLLTERFLSSGQGRVLDIGAGTGRSSIMVLRARPQATLVALDLFGESFQHHFGAGETPQQRLMANLKAAGVEQRTTIVTSDMRKLPFDNDAFDGIVSAYAIDHLNRAGSEQTLAEAARVLKPGGDFLLILISNNAWTKFAYGPLLSHGGTRSTDWWAAALGKAGFQIQEHGLKPMTLYFLARR